MYTFEVKLTTTTKKTICNVKKQTNKQKLFKQLNNWVFFHLGLFFLKSLA